MPRRGPKTLIALLGLWSASTAHGQFATIINVPPDMAPVTITSNTQVNVFAGANLDGFDGHGYSGVKVGDDSGSNSNIEVNVFDGRTTTLSVYADATINVSGGLVETISQIPPVKVNVNITGGTIRGYVWGGAGLRVEISGGSTGSLRAEPGSAFNLVGSDFKLNGVPVAGLVQTGDSVAINIPLNSLLTGQLSDGTLFSYGTFFHAPYRQPPFATPFNTIADGTLRLTLAAAAPPPVATVVNVPSDPMPPGVRSGQTLYLREGWSFLGQLTAESGAIINIEGSTQGDPFAATLQAVGANVNIGAGGIFNGPLRAYSGSAINVNDAGRLGSLDLISGSTATITGGEIGPTLVRSDAVLDVSGGSVGRSDAGPFSGVIGVDGSTINLRRGKIANLLAFCGASVNWSCGDLQGILAAFVGATYNLQGTSFLLDGTPIAGLEKRGDSLVLTTRGGAVLTGFLADSSPFDVVLGTQFSPEATLRLTVVPEPSTLALMSLPLMSAIGFCRRQLRDA
jgi:hypothetical protein